LDVSLRDRRGAILGFEMLKSLGDLDECFLGVRALFANLPVAL
jgi:hypothetical protein